MIVLELIENILSNKLGIANNYKDFRGDNLGLLAPLLVGRGLLPLLVLFLKALEVGLNECNNLGLATRDISRL
jgi:hypothetical protein